MPAHLTYSETIEVSVRHSKVHEMSQVSAVVVTVSDSLMVGQLALETRVVVKRDVDVEVVVSGSGFEQDVQYKCLIGGEVLTSFVRDQQSLACLMDRETLLNLKENEYQVQIGLD